MLSPTDAVAVSSIVDRNVVPSRLMHILEGESLLNDASGLVMFRFAVAAALTGSFSFAGASLSFLYAVAAGILAGVAALFIAAKALQLLNRIGGVPAEAQVLVMILLPFVAYLGAEHVGASGILAAVTAGLLTGVSGMYRHLGVSARMQTLSLWATLTFVFNGALFILLGLQLPDIIRKVPPELSSRHWLIEPVATVLILTLCLIGLRFLWIWVGDIAQAIAARFGKREAAPFGFRVQLAGSVAGVRGAITLAGILSLPLALQDGSPFPARDVVIFLAAGVIICSLVIASFALPRIARGVVEPGEDPAAAEERRARVGAAMRRSPGSRASPTSQARARRLRPGWLSPTASWQVTVDASRLPTKPPRPAPRPARPAGWSWNSGRRASKPNAPRCATCSGAKRSMITRCARYFPKSP